MGKTCSRCKQNSYIEINGRWYCEKCGNVESLPTVDENAELRAKLEAAEKTIEKLEKHPSCKNCETGYQVWKGGKLVAVLCEINSDNPERPTNRCWSHERKKEQ